jgi:hypothetical protein
MIRLRTPLRSRRRTADRFNGRQELRRASRSAQLVTSLVSAGPTRGSGRRRRRRPTSASRAHPVPGDGVAEQVPEVQATSVNRKRWITETCGMAPTISVATVTIAVRPSRPWHLGQRRDGTARWRPPRRASRRRSATIAARASASDGIVVPRAASRHLWGTARAPRRARPATTTADARDDERRIPAYFHQQQPGAPDGTTISPRSEPVLARPRSTRRPPPTSRRAAARGGPRSAP